MTKTTKKILGFTCAAVFALSHFGFAFPQAPLDAAAAEAGGIKLEAYGGKLTSDTVTLTDGVLPTLPVPEKEGYDFIGWYTQEVETEYWGDENGDNWEKYKDYYTNGKYTYIDGKSIEWYNAGETNPDTNPDNKTDYNWENSRWIETSVGLASATKGQPAKSGEKLAEGVTTLYAMYDPKNITVYWYSNGWNGIDDCWAVSTGRSTGFEYGGKFASLPLDDWSPWAGHEFKGWVDENGKKFEFTKVTYERSDVYSYILKDFYKPEKYEPILRLYAIYDGVTCRGGSVETATAESIGGSGGYFDPNKETYTFTALFDSRYKDLSSAKWEITSGSDLFDLKVSKDKTSATLSAKADKKDEIAAGGNYRIDIRLTAGGKSVEAYATAAHDWDNGKILSGLWNPCETPMNVRYTCKKCGQTREREYEPDGHRYTYVEHPATCTEDATRDRYCVVCGKTEHEILENTAKGHSYQTTTVKGCGGTVITSTCTTCGHVETQEDHTACHDWNSTYTIDKAATCTEEGSMSIRCKNCNVVKESKVIPATGHSYKDKTVKATCTEDGYTTHTCTKCGDSYTDAIVGATGHHYKETVERGCNGKEVTVKTCTVCGETETIGDRSALGHVWSEFHVDKAPTCTKEGSKSITCTVCGAVKETKSIPATGHSYTEDVHEPTCTEKGYVVKTCSACGDSVTEFTADAKGHDWKIETETGCGGATVVTKTCATCGTVEKTGDPSALDHVWGQPHVDREATCTTAGSKSVTCVKCGTVKERTEIPATGHSYRDEYHAPTCTENGYTVKTCTKCGDRLTVSGEAAKGHSYSKTETPATCTADGIISYHCTVCGDSYTEKGEGAKGHSYKSTEVKATCTADGTVTYRCTVCGDSYTEKGEAAKGHSYKSTEVKATCTSDGTVTYRCTVCGDSYTEKGEAAKGHDYDRSETSATCTLDGTVTYTCTACGNSYTEKGEAAKGHDYDRSETSATCTSDGTVTYTCTACGNSYTEKGEAAKGHDWDIEVETGCNGATFTTKTCNTCGELVTEGEREALAHTPAAEYALEEAPTCAKEGLKALHCAKCGEILETEVIPVTEEHVWGDFKTLAPTETASGSKTHVCLVCGKIEEITLPMLPPAEPETPEAPAPVEPETSAPVEPEVPAQPVQPEVPAPVEPVPEAGALPEAKVPAEPEQAPVQPEGVSAPRADSTDVAGSAVSHSAALEGAEKEGSAAWIIIALCTLLGAALVCVPVAVIIKRRK